MITVSWEGGEGIELLETCTDLALPNQWRALSPVILRPDGWHSWSDPQPVGSAFFRLRAPEWNP